MLNFKRPSSSVLLILAFGTVILAGTLLLRLDACRTGIPLGWLDALFTSTSAVCVTGLVVVDTGTFFSPTGQGVLLGLIQLGGLGIMTYTSLAFVLWRKKIALSDRQAVTQTLLHDPSFDLRSYLGQVVLACLILEGLGAVGLYLLAGEGMTFFSALFHAVSAFCNAGFSLHSDSLVGWSNNLGLNIVIMLLIICGGLGFAVLLELVDHFTWLRLKKTVTFHKRLSWHTRTVLTTSLALILFGTCAIFLAEFVLQQDDFLHMEMLFDALFQSVTCRTAGFNSMDIGSLTNISLLVMMFLMFVGGSPGSCAGGIKTTTLRALMSFCASRFKGRRQVVVARHYALDEASLNDALTLAMYAFGIIALATLALSVTEIGALPHSQTRGLFLEILFECVSAFGTVGLSTGLTGQLTAPGKVVITLLMFMGRLGPIVFITVLHDLHSKEHFCWPERRLPMG